MDRRDYKDMTNRTLWLACLPEIRCLPVGGLESQKLPDPQVVLPCANPCRMTGVYDSGFTLDTRQSGSIEGQKSAVTRANCLLCIGLAELSILNAQILLANPSFSSS